MNNNQVIIDQWIEEKSSQIGRTIYRLFGDGKPAPYLEFSKDSQDGVIKFQIGDHALRAGHVWWQEDQAAFEPLTLPIPESSGERVYVGYKNDLGIRIMIDPNSIVYEFDSETERPHPLRLFLDHVCGEFFDSWKEGQMNIRLAAIFRRTVSRNLTSLKEQKDRDFRRVQTAQREVDVHMAELANTNRRITQLETLDPTGFINDCKQWEDVLLTQGALAADDDNNIVLNMPVFSVSDQSNANNGRGNDVELGPMSVYFNLENYQIKVVSHGNLSYEGSYPHPHCDRQGRICFGNAAAQFESMLANPNPFEILFATAQFLKTGYHPPGAYQKLTQWRPPTGWMCDHCGIRHPDGEPCPQWCSDCEKHVNWDNHARCHEHDSCYDRPHMCTGCLAQMPKISDFATNSSLQDIPTVIQPPFYINPQNQTTRQSSLEYVGVGRRPFVSDQNGNFVDFVKEGNWHWIQSSLESDQLLRACDYIYRKQQNGTYQLHWTNPNPEQLETEEENENENLDMASQIQNLLEHYYQSDMTADDLVTKLHTDSIPEYSNVPANLQDALRAFRRKSNNQRLRIATRFIEQKEAA